MTEEIEVEYSIDFGKIAIVLAIIVALSSWWTSGGIYNSLAGLDDKTDKLEKSLTNDLVHLEADYNDLAYTYNRTVDIIDSTAKKHTICEADKAAVLTDLSASKSSLQSCNNDKSNMQNTINTLHGTISTVGNLSLLNQVSLNTTIASLYANITATKADFENFLNTSARTQCCIFNTTTASYNFQNYQITCSSSGNRTVNC